MNQLATNQHKILIVDDLEPNRMVLNDQVESLGHIPIMAENGVSALGQINSNNPDLVLLDIMMPEMDGYQVLETMKSDTNFRHIPVIMISAVDELESVVRCIQKGAVDYLVKPFNPFLLKARIDSALAIKRLHDQEANYRMHIEQYNLKLEDRVRERTRHINESRMEIIYRLGRAAEFRDNETANHVIRMSHLSARLGKEAGMDEEEVETLLQASPFHDIGKIGIPDNILLKPAKLNAEEWEVMKSHTEIGAEILSGSEWDLLGAAERIALTHHEKWDGSGYPKGLRGEDIPLEGRIVALCDVFDALTSERSYKDVWSVEDAMVFIEENSGTHFDPELVVLFKKILPEMIEIKEKYAEEKSVQV
jgi:putative two-component system response regulator